MTVSFFGHRDGLYYDYKDNLYEAVRNLITYRGAENFLICGFNPFDTLAMNVVSDLKHDFPHIKLRLVVAYIKNPSMPNEDPLLFDEIIYPALEHIPYKLAIIHRNRWIINNSTVVISGVYKSYGGACSAIQYAISRDKEIIQIRRSNKK